MAPSSEARELSRRVQAFQDSVAPDAYSVESFVPWDLIEEELRSLEEPILALQELVDRRQLTVRPLTRALRDEPEIATVARRLFTAPHAVGFVDGRELPEWFDPDIDSPSALARLLVDLGLKRILPPGSRVADAYRVAAIAVDSRRRGFRRKDELADRVETLIESAIDDVAGRVPIDVMRRGGGDLPEVVRNRAGAVVLADGRPVALVESLFQAISGGRQTRDLSVTYPRLQEELDSVPMCLVLIADGRGLLDARRALETLFESVHACLSFSEAEEGGLSEALLAAIEQRGVRDTRRTPLRTIIAARLRADVDVAAAELPAPFETARAALAEYVTASEGLALTLARDGASVSWTTPTRVAAAQAILEAFDPETAVLSLSDALSLGEPRMLDADSDELTMLVGAVPADPVLPEYLAIAATHSPATEDGTIAATVRAARQNVAGANVAVLITADASDWLARASPLPQRSMATSVVVLTADDVLEIVGSVRPRDALVRSVLEQADLTKASPFRSTGATPPTMFFGRQQEEAALVSALSSGSVAVLGARRIGKTSLLHRATSALGEEGWLTFYADLQEAGDWATFADHVRLRWDVDLPQRFAPGAIARMVQQLQSRGAGRLVLVLDEVDLLLRWDQDHGSRFVPEAFFRACRALSQEGAAQFVFSGERTIAQRLWDAASPHWNFCRPLPIQQLSREAADQLLERPLASLGVTIVDAGAALDFAWSRTHGHPQIVQRLGEELVKLLNTRHPDDRRTVSAVDLATITDQPEYAEHYVMTYWGQATALERAVSVAVASGASSWPDLTELPFFEEPMDGAAVRSAMRMLDLYGVVNVGGAQDPFDLRAAWLPQAMEILGGAAFVSERAHQDFVVAGSGQLALGDE